MESRQYRKLPGLKQSALHPSDDRNKTVTHVWPPSARPLSDIRELTEPSLQDVLVRKPRAESRAEFKDQAQVVRQSSMKRGPSLRRGGSVRIVEPSATDPGYRYDADDSDSSSNSSPGMPDNSSMYSIPLSSVPARASSQTREATKTIQYAAAKVSPTLVLSQNARDNTVPNRGPSCSPVKHVSHRLDPVLSETSRRVPSRTFVRTPQPRDILDFPAHRHPRIGLDIQVAAPLFVGGGSIEGHVRVVVDDAEKVRHKKILTVGRLAVDLIGVEETSKFRRCIFLSLGTELLDLDHPPPRNMVDPANLHPGTDSFWTVTPSFTSLPFMISLPLDTGPPPFHSKHAKIRFILCATLLVKDSGRQFLVRCSQDVAVLPTYDPEKALRSLPSPLTACDEFTASRSSLVESVKVTAGLHRQVWVGGSTIFVDVHIANNSRKIIKKLDLSLERDILCYRHAAAATLEQSASQARIFESNERSILSRSCLKQGAQGWTGVEAYGSITRTCDLDLPRGHATVKCGKYFEVRYFLNLCVSTSHTKLASVQLPIVLIHMNSLDVLPNSVAQVAAAIEQKRFHHNHGRSHDPSDRTRERHSLNRSHTQPSPSPKPYLQRQPSKIQGRAFAAPRQQSLERSRADAAELQQLGTLIDSSPRKYQAVKSLPRNRTNSVPRDPLLVSGNGNATIVSRPAREVHKQPSNLSLGGISVGSYTMLNDSSLSGGGMEYVTPPSKRKGRIFDMAGVGGLQDDENHDLRPTRSARSFDSIRSGTKGKWRDHFGGGGGSKKEKGSRNPGRQVHIALGPRDHHHQPRGVENTVGAHTLGLVNHVNGRPLKQPSPSTPLQVRQGNETRPSHDRVVGLARALSWRAKDDSQLDRGRFEFKAVRRKESGGGIKEWLGGFRGGKQQQHQHQHHHHHHHDQYQHQYEVDSHPRGNWV